MIIKTFRQIRSILLPAQQKKALINIALILGNAALEVFSLASIVPFILLVLDTSAIQGNPYLGGLYRGLGFQNEERFIIAAILLLLFLFIIKNALSIFLTYYQGRFVYDLSSDLSERAFAKYYSQSYSAFTNNSASRPTRDIIFNPTEFSVYVLLGSMTLLSEALIFLLISLAIALYDFRVFLLLAGILGPALFFVYRFKKDKLGEIGKISEELKPLSMKYLFQGIYAFIDAKIYGKESYFQQRFGETQRKLNRNLALLNTLNLLPARLIEIVAVLGMAGLVIYSLTFSANNNEIIILLSLFTAAAYRIMPSLNRIFISLVNIKTFQYTVDLLAQPDAAHLARQFNQAAASPKMRFRESLAFRNVSFAYPGEEAFKLRNVNFILKKGEIVGLVGPSGCGKTTIIHILLRFLKEQSGEILLDSRPLQAEDIPGWQRLIGYVKQDPFILDGSIAENIAFGEDLAESDEKRLQTVLQQAGLSEFIARLPGGAQTEIGERGAKLSGGQRQRLAIARALYRNSEILIFDEATSELDNQTEREILAAIGSLARQKKTILIIAHRLSTLKHCQRIYELKEGEISGVFRYADLAEKEKRSSAFK